MARRVCRLRVPNLLSVLVLGGVFAGCGPIVYVSEVTLHASDAVDAARAAHADKYAPYWWTRATQYLAKAREIAPYADFQGANRFGRLATEAANKATQEAKIAEQDPSKRPLEFHPEAAPVKDAPARDPASSGTAPAKDAPTTGPAPSGTAPAKEVR
jgi:hypothetical protein